MITPIQAADYFLKEISWKTEGFDTQYFIEKKSNGEVVIAFQGSNSKIDWKNNFSFWKKPYKDMDVKFFVHRGFLKCWKAIRDIIEKEVKDLNPASISITGHSYGGAIATLCKEDMWYVFPELRDKTQCITFGAPRVIGFYHYKKIKERWDNQKVFTNGSDIVTTLPPVIFGYRHVCSQFHLGKLRKCFDFFNPNIYHMIYGEEGYSNNLKKCSKGLK